MCVFVPYRLEDGWELDAEILHRSRLFPNLNDRLYATARSFKKIFQKFCFSLFLGEILTKKGSQTSNEKKIISFAIGSHFQPQKSKNKKIFAYPKIFQKFQTTISRLLFMPGTSAVTQIKGFCISFQ